MGIKDASKLAQLIIQKYTGAETPAECTENMCRDLYHSMWCLEVILDFCTPELKGYIKYLKEEKKDPDAAKFYGAVLSDSRNFKRMVNQLEKEMKSKKIEKELEEYDRRLH